MTSSPTPSFPRFCIVHIFSSTNSVSVLCCHMCALYVHNLPCIWSTNTSPTMQYCALPVFCPTALHSIPARTINRGGGNRGGGAHLLLRPWAFSNEKFPIFSHANMSRDRDKVTVYRVCVCIQAFMHAYKHAHTHVHFLDLFESGPSMIRRARNRMIIDGHRLAQFICIYVRFLSAYIFIKSILSWTCTIMYAYIHALHGDLSKCSYIYIHTHTSMHMCNMYM